MGATALRERYAPNLHGVLSCYDRIIVTGTLPGACYAGGMTSFLYSRGIRIFDYPRFAEPLRDRIRERAHQVCEVAGIQIEHVNKSHIRKECCWMAGKKLRASGSSSQRAMMPGARCSASTSCLTTAPMTGGGWSLQLKRSYSC